MGSKVSFVFIFLFSFALRAEKIPQVGGSNYTFIDIGLYAQQPTEDNWSKYVKVPTRYYSQNQALVRAQLDQIVKSGQKKIALMVWYVQGGVCEEGFSHVICPDKNGKLPAGARQNLQGLLQEIAARPFEQIQIRFGAQGMADPVQWTKWEEGFFQSDLNFILDVRSLAEAVFAGSKTSRLYDLGGELMAHGVFMKKEIHLNYLKRLWGEYVRRFGSKDSVGFSFNHCDYNGVMASFKVFKDSEFWPPVLALDIYDNIEGNLKNLKRALKDFGLPSNYPLYIQETFRNDPVSLVAFQKGRDQGLNILWIMQWSLGRNSGSKHTEKVDYSYDVYYGISSLLPVFSLSL